MSDIDLAVSRTKILESLLEQGLGAAGKGLHEKVSSVQDKLPAPLVKKLRYIATIRNKIVHESSYDKIDDRAGYTRACDEAEADLRAMIQPAPSRGCFFIALIMVGSIALTWRLV
jgi:hypothetical protein